MSLAAVMDYVYEQYWHQTLFLENISIIACRMKFKFGIWMLLVIDMYPILR